MSVEFSGREMRKLESIANKLASLAEDLKSLLVVEEEEEAEEEAEEEQHAHYDRKEDGFICDMSKKCADLVYEADEIVEHLQKKHGIDPDDQIIEGWTDKHERIWRRAKLKKGEEVEEEAEEEEEELEEEVPPKRKRREVEEEVEEAEFSPKEIARVKKEFGLTDDQVKYVVDYAKDEGISLEEAAETLIGEAEE